MPDTIIDNGAPGTSSTGAWQQSWATDQYTGPGANPTSLYAEAGPLATYRWTTPPDLVEGDYDVAVWFSTRPERGAAVPFDVMPAPGAPKVTKTFDERPGKGGGKWVPHGRYHFRAGGYIETNNSAGQAAADAVKLVLVAATPPAVVTPPVPAPVTPPPPPAGMKTYGVNLIADDGTVLASGTLTLPVIVTVTPVTP